MKSDLLRTLNFIKPQTFKYLSSMFLMILSYALLRIIESFAMKNIVNAATSRNFSIFYYWLFIICISVIISIIINPFLRWYYNKSSQEISRYIRKHVFSHMLNLPISHFDKVHGGIILSKLTKDINLMTAIYSEKIRRFLDPIVNCLTSGIAMMFLNLGLGIVLIIYNIILTVVNIFFSKYIKAISIKIQENFGLLTANLLDVFTGFSILKLFNVGNVIYNRYDEINDSYISLSKKKSNLVGILSSTNYFLRIISNIGVIIAGAYLIRYKIINLGTLLALINLQGSFNSSLLNASSYLSSIIESIAGSRRVFDLIDTPVEKINKINNNKKKSIKLNCNEIELLNIDFQYNDDIKVLKNLSLSIPKGKKVALVGYSGSGKTTIIKLLMKFYPTQSGDILIRGRSINNYDINELRNMIAYVPQDPYLFDGTIEYNISMGNINADKEKIINAAKVSYSHSFILKKQDGYQTQVGEKGIKLSGGQKQRICIARAILKNAPILLLDEATSSLDSESEQIIQKAIDNMLHDCTSIVIAHRLSTVKNADLIYVIDNGQVVEEGDHKHLLRKGGLYELLYKTQLS